jgi:LmbE family N-acetylglucosaminyl deacetylase
VVIEGSSLNILAVFAHPDDDTMLRGGVLAPWNTWGRYV